jgi:tetratricopeptide (TPR) repeat protein
MNEIIDKELKVAIDLEARGLFDQARTVYLSLIRSYPPQHEPYFHLGLLDYKEDRLEDAYIHFKAAISIQNDIAVYYRNFCEICRRLGRFEEAIQSGIKASQITPNDLDTLFNLGLVFLDIKDGVRVKKVFTTILEKIESGVTLKRNSWEVLHLKGFSYHRLNLFFDAKSAYEDAIRLNPRYAEAYNSLGSVLKDMQHLERALICFSKAVLIKPDFHIARLNLGMMQLQLGKWKEGWINYEARWKGSAESHTKKFLKPLCDLPEWDFGKDVKSKKIIIFFEQGYGDMIQFSRYLPLASQLFEDVSYVCTDPAMHELLDFTYKACATLLKEIPKDFSRWDYQCNLLSLPKAFGTEINTIPNQIPYLKVSQEKINDWTRRTKSIPIKRLNIGIAWAGRPTHLYDDRRSLVFDQIYPLLTIKDINWINLQKNYNYPIELTKNMQNWFDWSTEFTNFYETAGLISSLDLIVSVDSSMVHLAGSLGKDTWMMNRYDSEWRWLDQKKYSPWYKHLKIYNQPCFGDWSSVIEAIKNDLRTPNLSNITNS